MQLKNVLGRSEFHVSIACGVSFCTPDSPAAIRAAEEQADKQMYENKKYLKCMRNAELDMNQ